MMDAAIVKMLEKDVEPDAVAKLRRKCIDLVNRSRTYMGRRYSEWDFNNQVYLGEMPPDAEDKKAYDKKEPGKMIVPLTFAQIQSFASFVFLLLQQNRTFFELEGQGPEDNYSRDCEHFLERDMRHNKWPVLLYQTLIDAPRFGLTITDTTWKEDYVWVPQEVEVPPASFLGIPWRDASTIWETQKFLKYKGNEVKVISPYSFFPDHRLPMRDMQKGEFVAIDEEITDTQLAKLAKNNEVAGWEFLKPLTSANLTSDNINPRFAGIVPEGAGGHANRDQQTAKLVTKIQIDIVPKDLDIDQKIDYPVRYLVWIGNNQRIIRLEPMGYLHNQFTVNCAEFTPDVHNSNGRGLASSIEYLQNVVTWLINSHISSIRKTIDSKFIVDPAGIDTKSLESRSPYIFLKKNVSRSGVDRWIKQLQTVDATSGHMADADGIGKLIQMVTGVNDNAQGQYNSGRRSATESRAVTAGAASRLRMHTGLLWWQLYSPMGQQMLANSRQGMDEQLWQQVIGQPPQDPSDAQKYVERFTKYKGDPPSIAGMDDFMFYDETLPSEKGFIAQSLQELVGIAMSNPETSMAMNLNTTRMIEEIGRLRGIDNVEEWRNTPQETQQQMMQYAQLRQQVTSAESPGGPPSPAQ